MGNRKSIGNDPLDWVGERPVHDRSSADKAGAAPGPVKGSEDDGAMIPLPAPSTAMALERQLLLVDNILADGPRRPRLNQVLSILLVLVTAIGMGLLFFQEARRSWSERIQVMEGTIERIEKEKGRNERILEQVIGEKDELIREKQGTISKIEAIHQSLAEELRIARTETHRLTEENRSLRTSFLDAPRREFAGAPAAGEALQERPAPAAER